MKIKKISNGVRLCSYETEKFKTAVISLSITAPLDSHAGENALLAHLLSRTSRAYPTVLEMNRKLASLYGAAITPSVIKQGDAQILTLNLTSLDDRFTLKNESVCEECTRLLISCLFEPDISPEGFKRENLEREKRLLVEKIEAERDDKRLYALTRMTEEMCRDEAYGIGKYGSEKDVRNADGKAVFEQWKKLLLTCPIQISAVGSFASKAEEIIKPYFDRLGRDKSCEIRTEFITEAKKSQTVSEKQKVKQGKLVIGMRAGMTYDMDNYAAIRLMTAIFGGGTFSKLFVNVREKMSLCYYCAARLVSSKGIITVESGVETENAEKALSAIRNELDEVKRGNFTDETLQNAKLSICDALESVMDSNSSINAWFMSFCTSGAFFTPREIAEKIMNVSREEVIVAANEVTEDTVYILQSESEENTDE